MHARRPDRHEAATLDAVFSALADGTRRDILARLMDGPASVTELARPFAMSQPAVSKHLRVLERAGLVARGQEAQWRPRRLNAGPLRTATAWLADYREFWEGSFDQLDRLLDSLDGSASRPRSPQRRGNDAPRL